MPSLPQFDKNKTWAWFALAVSAHHFLGPVITEKFQSPAQKKQNISYTDFKRRVAAKQISNVLIFERDAIGLAKNKQGELYASYKTLLPQDPDIDKIFSNDVDVVNMPTESNTTKIFFDILSIVGGIAAFDTLFGISSVRRAKNKVLKKKEITVDKSKVTFDDVAGIDEIKAEVQEIVNLLCGNDNQKNLGIKTPKGLLLAGGPGNGKTLLAKAIAGEAGIPFYSASATSFENKWYGESSKQVRDLFDNARKHAPCIIFIDEIDAVGRARSSEGEAHDSIVVELLSQMDGFEDLENVLVIAATNQPQVLDAALLRPGRFDRQIVIPSPDVNARVQILEVHTKNRPLADDVELNIIAQRTFGFSGAELANLVNEAAINAARRPDADKITAHDFDVATDRIVMGIQRSLNMTEAQKWVTAVHEAGHTIILEEKPELLQPLHKVTIVPHGQALGLTVMRPETESYGYTLKELKAQLVMLFAGRVAEEIMLGGPEEVGTGASNDIQRATNIAWNMVTKFGFSDLGPIKFGSGQEGYLGETFDHDLNEHTAAKVYEEVGKLIKSAEDETRQILTAKKPQLEQLAKGLMAKETMMANEVRTLLAGPQP